ncbi:MAG: GDP-mannose 4,6-dehydratase [Methanothrix sp.]|jgi:GDPmannose 4,6-dehydratase|uniref:GDP-mannose 4,6-dehydratase n=1 Tax=Methanothrix sp. TaxID=90426 RepID=UPI0025DAC665|nr:GDP-mannose 4,6-dehydratase [Methanothrix sp.]MCK9407445.1 GDP-mannose 4,6-dehydratase [Methanothrix sp.]
MSLNNKNILITGISGFVGSYIAKTLIDKGAKVYGILRRRADGAVPNNLKRLGIAREVHLLEGDLENISSLGSALSVSRPDIVFHLGAQSFVPRSFIDPLETMSGNCEGTANLLEAIRIKDMDPVVVFAGSSEEYGLVISSKDQYKRALEKYGTVFPEPQMIPEVPISEANPLRPMSPYAVSKVYGDFLMRNYWHSYGIKTVVSRAFNHEGAGRGIMFVTSVATSQVMKLKLGETDSITIGNVNAFRDWSHVSDIADGYMLLAENGKYGEVYNQGSMRTNSVLSYLLMSLAEAGYPVSKIETLKGDKVVEDPIAPDTKEIFGIRFEKTKVDDMMLRGNLEFTLEDGGIVAYADSKRIKIAFDPNRFRPAEVPILLSDTTKIENLGFNAKCSLKDVVNDQLNHYLSEMERKG